MKIKLDLYGNDEGRHWLEFELSKYGYITSSASRQMSGTNKIENIWKHSDTPVGCDILSECTPVSPHRIWVYAGFTESLHIGQIL